MTPVPVRSSRAAPAASRPPRLATIQAPVADRLDGVLDEIRRIVVSDFALIEEVNEYLLLVRGKLFRPTLLLLSSEVGGSPRERAVTLAAVVELVHLATLVHDDAVDHSVLRRGLPTVNALWTHQIAIIMGDYLYSRSVTELAQLGDLEAVRVLARAANEMSMGEMRQLTSYDTLSFSEDDYFRLIAAKTASLMSAACELGALAGSPTCRAPLARFGHHLGMAFQIADDLLDYTGTEAVTGKPTGHDLRERKVTLPLVGALAKARETEIREIRRFFTRIDPTDEEIGRIVAIVEERGGLEYARERAAEYAERAEAELEALPGGVAVQALRDAVSHAVGRSS
jgi:octaprenyl-diphosphate synthase